MTVRRRAALAATLAAALPLPAPAAEPGRLVVWYPPKGLRAMTEVAAAFTRETGIPVTVEAPEDGAARFQRAAAAGKGPDIFVWAHDRFGEWVSSGLLAPVAPGRAIAADIDPLAWSAMRVNGRTWGYPLMIESVALVYNKALVPVPPATFDDLVALDAALAPRGVKAILWDYGNAYFSWPLLAAGGGYAFRRRDDGRYDGSDTGVATPGAVAGLSLIDRLLQGGQMPRGAGYAQMEGAMVQGKVAMMINGPWSWDNLRKARIDFGVAKIPAVGGRPAAPFVGVRGVVVNKASPNRELAVEFIEHHLLTPAGLRVLHRGEPIVAPASRAFCAEIAGEPGVAATLASAKDGAPMPNNPEMGRFWSSMAAALANVSEGRQTPREALDAAARRITAK